MPYYHKHEAGLYEAKDSNRSRRFLWRQQIEGEKINEWFETLNEAKKAKKGRNAKLKRYGSRANDFTEKDWIELKLARAKLPDGATLIQAVEYYAKRHPGGVYLTIPQAVKVYMDHQGSRRNSARHFQNCQSHLNKLISYIDEVLVKDVTRKQVWNALKEMGEVIGARSVLNHRATWAAFFKHLVKTENIESSPMVSIEADLLPVDNVVSTPNPLEVDQVAAIMKLYETDAPQYCYWLALQFFVGFRTGEADRFRPEWVQERFKTIVTPGWFKEDGEVKGGTKTRDNWMIDKVPENFWAWHTKYGKPSGQVEGPGNNYQLTKKISKPIVAAGICKEWPHNAKRDSFCTYHLSTHRDAKMTSLILKHRGTDMLWNSYMGTLRTEEEGKAYFSVLPDGNPMQPQAENIHKKACAKNPKNTVFS